ncbi:hypothetical protein AB4212_60320, partial [Streptomyces sp. 2MCAF27]
MPGGELGERPYPGDGRIPATAVSRRRPYPGDGRIPATAVSRRRPYPGDGPQGRAVTGSGHVAAWDLGLH